MADYLLENLIETKSFDKRPYFGFGCHLHQKEKVITISIKLSSSFENSFFFIPSVLLPYASGKPI